MDYTDNSYLNDDGFGGYGSFISSVISTGVGAALAANNANKNRSLQSDLANLSAKTQKEIADAQLGVNKELGIYNIQAQTVLGSKQLDLNTQVSLAAEKDNASAKKTLYTIIGVGIASIALITGLVMLRKK